MKTIRPFLSWTICHSHSNLTRDVRKVIRWIYNFGPGLVWVLRNDIVETWSYAWLRIFSILLIDIPRNFHVVAWEMHKTKLPALVRNVPITCSDLRSGWTPSASPNTLSYYALFCTFRVCLRGDSAVWGVFPPLQKPTDRGMCPQPFGAHGNTTPLSTPPSRQRQSARVLPILTRSNESYSIKRTTLYIKHCKKINHPKDKRDIPDSNLRVAKQYSRFSSFLDDEEPLWRVGI